MAFFTSLAMSSLNDDLARLETRRAELRRALKAIEAENDRLEDELSQIDDSIEATVAAIDDLQDEIDDARSNRHELD